MSTVALPKNPPRRLKHERCRVQLNLKEVLVVYIYIFILFTIYV